MRAGALSAAVAAILWAGGSTDRMALAADPADPGMSPGAANLGTPAGADAIARFESYLERYPDSPSRPEVLFTLGQLYQEAETGAAIDASGLAGEVPNAIGHPNAIRCFTAVADSYPEFVERAACLYRLGIVLMEAGEPARAERRLRALIAEPAVGAFAGPARLRLAELAERRAAWADAARLYGEALIAGVDPHQEKLHYRRAWALYKSADEAGAIAALRDGIALEERLGSDADAGFLRETLTLLASLQSRVPGAAGWEQIVAEVQGSEARRRFLAELGMQLEEADRAAAALPVLDRALAEGPDHAEAPLVARAAIRAADRMRDGGASRGEDAIDRRLRFEETYGSASAWRRRVALPREEIARLDDLCEQSVYEAGALLYDAARRDTSNAATAERAEKTLRLAQSHYPGSESRDDASFLIGELARASGRWDDAVASYDAANADALSKERQEPLFYGRLLAREGARGAAAAAHGSESEAARRAAAAAGAAVDAYLARFPQAPSERTLRSKRAELLALAGDPAAAAESFRVLFGQAPAGSKASRELAGLVAANLARSGRYDEASSWYDTAADPERAAAALYEGAQREAAADRPGSAGLALIALRARYPRANVSWAAALDAIDLLSRAGAADTLAAWVATLEAPAAPASGSGPARADGAAGKPDAPTDSLQRALASAARRVQPRNPAGAGRLYREAARFGGSEGAAAALVSAGEALCAAGRPNDAAAALSAAIVRFPRDPASLLPVLFAADLLADSLGDAAGAATLLEKAAGAARAAAPGERAAWRRRTAHALARSGRALEAAAAFDRCLADTTAFVSATRESAAPAARAPESEAPSDSLLFEREIALAAIEKADIVRAGLPAPAPKKMAPAEAKRLHAKTDEAVGLYAFVIGRGFRDLTSRGGHDAAAALEGTARSLLEAGIAARDPSLCESARRAAGRAISFRAAVAALPVTPPDAWMRSAAEGLDLRSRLAARLLAAADSIAPPAAAEGLDEKTISSRIVALDRLAELLAPARGLALDDSSADLEAQVALARGGFVERMAGLLVAAPVPKNLGADGEAAYRKAVQAKSGEFEERAAAIYHEALDHAQALGERSEAARELEQRLALLTARVRGTEDEIRSR